MPNRTQIVWTAGAVPVSQWFRSCTKSKRENVQAENPFFEHPVLNSPYTQPACHWELDASGQPTQRVIQTRRRAEFITPFQSPRSVRVRGRRRTSSSMRAGASPRRISGTPRSRLLTNSGPTLTPGVDYLTLMTGWSTRRRGGFSSIGGTISSMGFARSFARSRPPRRSSGSPRLPLSVARNTWNT